MADSSESGLVRYIPSGIVSDIISRLPLEDIVRCSTVSTDFYQITKNLHCSNHLHNTKSQVLDILLAKSSFERNLGSVGVDDSLHLFSGNSKRMDGKCKHLEIPHQNEFTGRIISSCNGLLCLAYSMGSPYAIYNPITKETMMLPKLELHPQCKEPNVWIRSGFGYDPIDNKYKVVVSYYYRSYIDDQRYRLKATGDIITVGESSWKRLEFPNEVKGSIDTQQPAVFINGAFHWLNGTQYLKDKYRLHGILTLDISTEKFNLIKYSASMDLDVSFAKVFNIGSSLALVGKKLGDDSVEDNSKPPPTKISVWKIWKILGENADGGCLYECKTLNVDLMTMKYPKPVGALGNNKFLFKVLKQIPENELNYLILYDTENDKGSVLEIPAEVPTVYDATIFQPSLVSPTSLRMYSH